MKKKWEKDEMKAWYWTERGKEWKKSKGKGEKEQWDGEREKRKRAAKIIREAIKKKQNTNKWEKMREEHKKNEPKMRGKEKRVWYRKWEE